jgi:uncharacterized lipoprotein YmbA
MRQLFVRPPLPTVCGRGMGRGALALALFALVSACASSVPMRYYTLTPVAPASPATATTAVRLGHISIPREIDRLELVQRIDATRLTLHEQDRWAAPLEDLLRRTLNDDLVARLPESGSSRDAARTLSIDIDELIADASCNVTLRATWTLTAPQAPSIQKTERITTPADGACATSALPATMSRALGELSDHIASAIGR